MSFRDKKDEESGAAANPFQNLEKSRVLQEVVLVCVCTCAFARVRARRRLTIVTGPQARKFNEMPISPKKCSQILTKIIFLICQGETIAPHEATDTFFAATKLFQCPDVRFLFPLFSPSSTTRDLPQTNKIHTDDAA
jgi:coatomer protein complex subunit gamma